MAGKLVDTLDISFGALYDMILAPIKSRLLLTALELKVFDRLAEFKSASEVAQSLGSHPRYPDRTDGSRLESEGLTPERNWKGIEDD